MMSKQTALGPETVKIVSSDSQELSIGDLLQIFFHRKGIILILTLLCLLLATAYFLIATNKYTATATIEINKDNSMSLGLDDLSGIGSKLGTGTDLLTDMMTHEEDLENETTAIDTIKRMKLLDTKPFAVVPGRNQDLDRERGLPLESAPYTRAHALVIFLARLKVDLIKNTRLLTVSYTDTDPVRAAQVANTIVDVYLSNHTEARYAASLKTSNWLTEQLAELKDKVADSERKVTEFQQKEGLVGVYVSIPTTGGGKSGAGGAGAGSAQVSSTDDARLLALNDELTRAEVERIAKEALYRFAQSGDSKALANLSTSSLVGGDSQGSRASSALEGISQLQSLRQQETILKLQYASQVTKYGPHNPEMIDVNNQLAALGGQVQDTLARILKGTKSDYEIALLSENNIRQQVRQQEKVVGKLDQSVAGLMVLEQESNASRLLYQDMYTRLEEANLSAGMGSGVITIANPARPAAKPSAPNPLKVFPIGLSAGLLLGAMSALLLDHVQNIVYGTETFIELLPFAQLGIVPDFNANTKSRRYGNHPPAPQPADLGKVDPGRVAWLYRDPTSPISEAFRQLRTSILMSQSGHPPKTLLFTSALSGDGKTVTSFNLATAFAYQGARVLLVDADMRRPTMHLVAGCSGAIGLSNVLTGSASTAEAILPHADIDRLFILPAGTIPPMPAELLGSNRFAELLTELEAAYDYVLIDTPPLLLVTDPLLLAPMVEGIVLITRSGRDTKPALKSAVAMLSKPQIHVLGYVINGVSMTSTYYRYDGPEN